MVSRELQARAGLLQARAGHLGLGGRLVLVAYRLNLFVFMKVVQNMFVINRGIDRVVADMPGTTC